MSSAGLRPAGSAASRAAVHADRRPEAARPAGRRPALQNKTRGVAASRLDFTAVLMRLLLIAILPTSGAIRPELIELRLLLIGEDRLEPLHLRLAQLLELHTLRVER